MCYSVVACIVLNPPLFHCIGSLLHMFVCTFNMQSMLKRLMFSVMIGACTTVGRCSKL